MADHIYEPSSSSDKTYDTEARVPSLRKLTFSLPSTPVFDESKFF